MIQHKKTTPQDVVDLNKITNTRRIVELDKKHHLHPYQLFDVFPKDGALPIESGDGCYITDTNGKQYLDAVGGMWCNNIGLGSDEMADAIAEQARKISYATSFVDLTNVPATELAARLAELAPGNLNHVFLTTGGSTAVDAAIRLVQFYHNSRGKTGKRHIISRKDSYHGNTYLTISLGGKAGDRAPEFNYISDWIHHLSSPKYYRYGKGLTEVEFANKLVQEFKDKVSELGGPEKVAAFIAEPIMGSGGVILPPDNYIKKIWEYCRVNDILYISDEVVTSFGRLGYWFASKDVFDIQPDIITTAKGLSSGYIPMGATLFSEDIWNVISEPNKGRVFTLGYTYSSHPVGCIAALKNIEIMEREDILGNARKVGAYFIEQLKTLSDLGMVGDVRGMNLMACVEFVKNKETQENFPDEIDIGKRVANEADEMGLMVRPIVNLNVMSPPLTLTKEQVDFTVSTLRKAIIAAGDKLKAEGLW